MWNCEGLVNVPHKQYLIQDLLLFQEKEVWKYSQFKCDGDLILSVAVRQSDTFW